MNRKDCIEKEIELLLEEITQMEAKCNSRRELILDLKEEYLDICTEESK